MWTKFSEFSKNASRTASVYASGVSDIVTPVLTEAVQESRGMFSTAQSVTGLDRVRNKNKTPPIHKEDLPKRSVPLSSSSSKQSSNDSAMILHHLMEELLDKVEKDSFPKRSISLNSLTSSISSDWQDELLLTLIQKDPSFVPLSLQEQSALLQLQKWLLTVVPSHSLISLKQKNKELEKERDGLMEKQVQERELNYQQLHMLQQNDAQLQLLVRESLQREDEMKKQLKKANQQREKDQLALNQLKEERKQLEKGLQHARDQIDHLDRIRVSQHSKLQAFQENASSKDMSSSSQWSLDIQKAMQHAEKLERALGEARHALEEKTEGFLRREQELLSLMKGQEVKEEDPCLVQLKSQWKTLYADKCLVDQDIKRLACEVTNLETLLAEYQSEKKEMEKRWKESQSIHEEELKRINQVWEGKWKDLQDQMESRKETLRQNLGEEMKREKDDNLFIEKKIASGLIVSYIESNHRFQVLEVVSKILDFTLQEKERVGLIQRQDESHIVNVKNFEDVFEQFLLNEIQDT